jgi:hypothetical protein
MIMIDFDPVRRGEQKFDEFSAQFDISDLRKATNGSIDYLLDVITGLTDADIIFEPHDPDADDPYAVDGEEHIGWSIAHLIVHVTASSEEGAAFSSLLARGIPIGGRLRYETPWREITTIAQCVQRLEESRAIRLGYLDTWPQQPFLTVYRDLSERMVERFGPMNATGSLLFGLSHEVDHYEQFSEVKRQALANR